MAYELLMGINVVDEEQYSTYRAKMTPILKTYGGGFRYDFTVAEVLQSETDQPMNRVFAIYFPNEQVKDDFFADEAYIRARDAHFASSTNATTVIATYQTD